MKCSYIYIKDRNPKQYYRGKIKNKSLIAKEEDDRYGFRDQWKNKVDNNLIIARFVGGILDGKTKEIDRYSSEIVAYRKFEEIEKIDGCSYCQIWVDSYQRSANYNHWEFIETRIG